MNSGKTDAGKLPDGWVLCKSKSKAGRKYYFNKKTGKSSWTQPEAEDQHDKSKKKSKKQKEKPKQGRNIETPKKSLKRKSDTNEESSTKKQKTFTPIHTPEKDNLTAKKIHEKHSTSANKTPEKSSPYSANSRLAKLRAQLSNECQQENIDITPKSKARIRPKNLPQTETQPKFPELKSPIGESRCTNTHSNSPGSESLHTIPSPSQFLAASKILSSISKSLLPEEYSNKSIQKDTFADIEQGIYNQTAEYPYLKHPATPPQFSEASKLVSAIKSKLSYKLDDVKTFPSAKDRMEAIRADLSNEVVEEKKDHLDNSKECPEEAMEVDCKELKSPSPPPIIPYPPPKEDVDSKSKTDDVVLVVDTNIFIHELDVIKNILNSHIKGYSEPPTLLVPWRVVTELDRLKDNNNGQGAICKRARAAMDYLYKSLPEDSNRIKGQSLRDANCHIHPCEVPDDEILNCALQQAGRGQNVILLSNDKNLCNKAMINSLRCVELNELKGLLENKPQPEPDSDRWANVRHARDAMHQLLANILENEMRAKYNNLWKHVLFKPPPWSLADVLQCLLKHWIAVFNEVFPRIEHLINDLKNSLAAIEGKDPNSLSQSEESNFQELCLDVAQKCQIIPEYMELAKSTVERLQRRAPPPEVPVIEAFERVWTVFSSYCAKLATALGVPHSLEDALPNDDPPAVVSSRLPLFSNQLDYLTMAIQGALSVDPAAPSAGAITRLETVFKDSVNLAAMDSRHITQEALTVFCVQRRYMLQEACTKFSQLKELLDLCKQRSAY